MSKIRKNGAWVDKSLAKKRVNGAWVDADKDYYVRTPNMSGTPPFTFKSDGENLRDWSMAGQTVQASTPTPSSPVAVEGVGERTAQLYNDVTKKADTSIIWATGAETSREGYELSDYITVGATETLTASRNVYFAGYDSSKTYLGTYYQDTGAWDKNGRGAASTFPNSVGLGAAYVRILSSRGLSGIMLNTGSTALPYEPYGYKIPITCGNTTTNIYLGTATSTRRVKKLVLTGSEASWRKAEGSSVFYRSADDYPMISGVICVCTHYAAQENVTSASGVTNGCVTFSRQQFSRYYIRDDSISTLDDFKTYLQQQYTAGTPVTIWYVLATAETTATNEPLMKIGTYADELTETGTGVNIPTVSGSNTLAVNTTVQPSGMTIQSISQWV